jgi:hypothetical protein
VSERRIDPEGVRRLKEAGFVPETSPTGKQRWQDPQTGRMTPVGTALDRLERRQEQEIEEAGWRRQEIEGEIYWRKPGSGYLYPLGPAYDVHKRRDQG